MQNSHVILHLSLIDGVGPVTIAKIGNWITKNAADWTVLYTMSARQISAACQLAPSVAEAVAAGLADQKLLGTELALIEKHTISWMTIYDETYPALLAATYAPPIVLYWRGLSLSALSCVAVIGSRCANQYGNRVINLLVPQLVSRGITIVSGGAIGADTMAHKAALAAGGTTVAVLGSGLLRPYPRTNDALFKTIADGQGAVVSSFPLMTSPLPGNFPARNRIIAGLSSACIVVQAAAKSGATITAQYALEEGREVCAVPGAIDDELSAGCHALISQGATLVHDMSNVHFLANMGAEYLGATVPQTALKSPKEIEELTTDGVEMTPSEKLISLCHKPQSLDDLSNATGYPVSQLQDLLFELQLSGRLIQDFTGMWLVA